MSAEIFSQGMVDFKSAGFDSKDIKQAVPVNGGLAAEFEALLVNPNYQVQAAGSGDKVFSATEAKNAFAAEKTAGLGDKVLGMMGQITTQVDNNFNSVTHAFESVNPEDVGVVEMAELHFEVIRLEFELNVTTKVIGESNNHADRLLNQQ